MKKTKGITLVALIITIIIMLILVAVTVSLVVNSNLLGRAKNAGDEWEAAQIRDNNEANNFEAQIAEWEASLCDHEWGEWVVTTPATCTATGIKTATCTKCGGTKTETIPQQPHTYANGKGSCIYGCGEMKDSLAIGAKIVGYNPTVGPNNETISTSYTVPCGASSTTNGVTTITTSGSGYSNAQNFALSSYEWRAGETGAMEWKVLGEENGQILITTADPIQTSATSPTGVCFTGLIGFSSYEDELNKICSMYGQGKYADTSKYTLTQTVTGNTTTTANASGARSIRLEDLQLAGYMDAISSGTKTYTTDENGKSLKDDETSSGNSFTYWDEYVGGTKTWITLGANSSVTMIDPQNSYTTKSLGSSVRDRRIYNMIFKRSDGNTDASYYLASRYVLFGETGTHAYCIRYVLKHDLDFGRIRYSTGTRF